MIREKILGGSAQISGSFTHEEATDLAIVLRVGALPAPVDVIQNLTVGASLGQDSIRDGLYSGLAGALLVVLFISSTTGPRASSPTSRWPSTSCSCSSAWPCWARP